MGVSLVEHIRQGLKIHSILVENGSRFEVGLSIGDSTASHIDLSSYLDALLIPQRPEVVISDPTLTFGPV